MRQLLAIPAIAIAAGLGWVVYQSSLTADLAETKPSEPKQPLAVHVTKTAKRSIEEFVELIGSLEAGSEVEIRSRIDGYITRLPFDVGDSVSSGDVLVELDDSKNKEMVSGSEAALTVAKAQLKAQKTKVDLAKTEVKRNLELAKSGVSTEQQQDQVKAQLAIAEAEYELEEAKVAQAASNLSRSKLALDEMRINAPFSGYVAERLVESGDLANPDDPLIRIVNLDTVHTAVHVVEKDYRKVKAGQEASIQVDAFPEKTFIGEVISKSPVLDPQTRTAAIRIEIENKDHLLKPGMHARVRIVFQEHKQSVVVPIASLVGDKDAPAIFVVTGNPQAAQLRQVKIGISDGEMVEILSGIGPDDRIVTLGSRLIESGQEVRPIDISWQEAMAHQSKTQTTVGE
jgi:RND family efflux transporter MFP subunit